MNIGPYIKDYINVAFAGDEEILQYYDKSQQVTTIADVCENVYMKLMNLYSDAVFMPFVYDGHKLGYFAYSDGLLISFGVNKRYRTREALQAFWDEITDALGQEFSCALYGHNTRGIEWLKKCGMQVLGENVTILIYTKT